MEYRKIYKESVEEINPSPELIERIKTGKEKKIMKMSKRRMVIVAAVAVMMMGTTAFAASKYYNISSYVSWSDPRTNDTNYEATCEAAENAGITIAIPEELSNGYKFDSSNDGGMKGLDEEGNTVASGDMFTVTYAKADCPDISVIVSPSFEEADYSDVTSTRDIAGVTVCYSKDTYKFVPVDYKLTEEDEKNLNSPHYYISNGADEIEINTIENVYFWVDGKFYNILSTDNTISEEEWFDIAAELLK